MSILAEIFGPGSMTIGVHGPDGWPLDALGGIRTASGATVTADGALRLSAYWACIRAVSEDIAKLPLIVYKRRSGRGKDRDPDHPIYRLLHDTPNPQMGSMAWRETMMLHAQGWGGGFSEIERDGAERALALHIIHPSRIKIHTKPNGSLLYGERLDDAGVKWNWIRQENMLHIHGLGGMGKNGYGLSVLAREAIGLGLEVEKFGATFFANGTVISGILSHPATLSDPARANLRKTWGEKHGGDHQHSLAITEEGMTYTPLGIPPEQAQFLATREFQVEDIARWFRIPPHKIGHLKRSTFSNIESQAIEYVVDTLQPWAVRWEQEIKRKLFRAAERDHFAEHLFEGLLRGDQVRRATYYRQLFSVGALSQNDILELENRNGIGAKGDVYYVPLNMVPSEIAMKGPQKPKTAPPPGENDEDPSTGSGQGKDAKEIAAEACRPLFDDALQRVVAKEARAAERAAKKHEGNAEAFAQWASRFYGDHEEYIVDALAPAAESWAMLFDGQACDDVMAEYAVAHVDKSISDLIPAFAAGTVGERLDLWRDTRAQIGANTIITALREAQGILA